MRTTESTLIHTELDFLRASVALFEVSHAALRSADSARNFPYTSFFVLYAFFCGHFLRFLRFFDRFSPFFDVFDRFFRVFGRFSPFFRVSARGTL